MLLKTTDQTNRIESLLPRILLTYVILGLSLLMVGCGGSGTKNESKREFISVGTAPAGGAFYTVGSAVCEVVNENRGDLNWRVNAESTGGSMENIRLLSQGKLQFAMSNSSITYFAVRGSEGWEETHDVKSVLTLFPNVAMFVTLANSGIEKVSDLKGKSVFLGPEGAGFEFFVKPILAAHGLTLNDIDGRFGSQQSAVDLLGDGAVAAAMIGGGTPNPSLSQMAQANSIRLIPYDEEAKAQLIKEYSFFEEAIIPGGTYNGIEDEFKGLNVGSAHLITHQSVDEQMVYDFVKLAYEQRTKIAERHRAASNIRPETAAAPSGIDYHPGAERYFREIGTWPKADEQE
jgi:TRAP transporter TAXI family solute receptor